MFYELADLCLWFWTVLVLRVGWGISHRSSPDHLPHTAPHGPERHVAHPALVPEAGEAEAPGLHPLVAAAERAQALRPQVRRFRPLMAPRSLTSARKALSNPRSLK